jgi:AcrR family transcriptional regulator
MAETADTADAVAGAPPGRRRRSDARRSVDAILGAARTVLGERPGASVEEIATAAGVSRQTVYAHFPSRDALVAALVEAARVGGLAELDAAGVDSAPPAGALAAFLDTGWGLLRRYPLLFDPALNRSVRADGSDPHAEVTERLERIIRRGQRGGDFDRGLSASWLAAAILELGHTAAAHAAAGRLTTADAQAVLLESALRLCGARR